MSEENNKLIWKLAWFKGINGLLQIGAMAFLGSTAATHWEDLHPFEKFTILLAAYVQMSKYVEAFLDTTASKLLSGKPPIGTNGTGNTEVISKTIDASKIP